MCPSSSPALTAGSTGGRTGVAVGLTGAMSAAGAVASGVPEPFAPPPWSLPQAEPAGKSPNQAAAHHRATWARGLTCLP